MRKESSFSAVVGDLQIGECASRAQAVPGSITVSEMAEQLTSFKAKLLNNSTPAIRSAMRTEGGKYTTSVSETVTTGGDIFLVLIVKRIG